MSKNIQKVNSAILLSANAEIVEQIDVQPSVAISSWKIDRNSVNYNKHDSHTLSLYVKGGETSFRNDQPANKGAPGKITLMPQDHESNWSINGEIEFVHFYFTDAILKQYAAVNFDCDVRTIELQDLTYKNDLQLQSLILEYFQIHKGDDYVSPIYSEQMIYNVFQHVLNHYNGSKTRTFNVQGGLSISHIRKIKAMIEACLGDKLTISTMANEVGLSHFHFAKMFKESFGEPPAQFVNRLRIERVKQHLKTNKPISEISVSTGYNQQSHMTQQFKNMTGMTPAVYRSAIR